MPKGMNVQGKLVTDGDGKTKVAGGIEWTKTILPDDNEYQGYTMNPVGGCMHRCRWIMPDSGCSFEPLAWDVSGIVAEYPGALKWAVIGAASDGPRKFQPNASDIRALLDVLGDQGVPVFYKGNLRGNAAAEPWREEFPVIEERYHHVPSYGESEFENA